MKVTHKALATRFARRFNRQGLTLIELLVVLVILIALAGILIPQLPNMLTRAHTAAASTNLPEANKAIQEFEQIYFKQPANLDNLIDSTNAKLTYLPNSADLTIVTLTANQADALVNAGITTLAQLNTAAGTSPTFNPYNGTTLTTAASVKVAGVDQTKVQALLRPGSLAGDEFVAFGIGQASELVGRTINEAPYHFGDEAGSDPNTKYTRYLAVYQVSSGDGGTPTPASTPLTKAAFVGVLSVHSDGLANNQDHIAEFFNANKL